MPHRVSNLMAPWPGGCGGAVDTRLVIQKESWRLRWPNRTPDALAARCRPSANFGERLRTRPRPAQKSARPAARRHLPSTTTCLAAKRAVVTGMPRRGSISRPQVASSTGATTPASATSSSASGSGGGRDDLWPRSAQPSGYPTTARGMPIKSASEPPSRRALGARSLSAAAPSSG